VPEHVLSRDILAVLWFLLPGFVAAWVFAGLTAYPKLSEFERVVEALIFTAFAQTATFVVRGLLIGIGHLWSLGPWSDDVGRAWSISIALILGLAFARAASRDSVHRRLREWGFTPLTGFPSEWFGVFRERIGTHAVVLHMSNERRLYARVDEFPNNAQSGHFSLYDAAWLDRANNQTALTGVARILVPAADVSLVEFLEIKEERNG